jgi:ATP-dependent RNA circularization protein (DNA/RNA ligase family)
MSNHDLDHPLFIAIDEQLDYYLSRISRRVFSRTRDYSWTDQERSRMRQEIRTELNSLIRQLFSVIENKDGELGLEEDVPSALKLVNENGRDIRIGAQDYDEMWLEYLLAHDQDIVLRDNSAK